MKVQLTADVRCSNNAAGTETVKHKKGTVLDGEEDWQKSLSENLVKAGLAKKMKSGHDNKAMPGAEEDK